MDAARFPAGPSASARELDLRRSALVWLWLGNVVLGACIGLAYLRGLVLDGSPRLWIFAHLGLVSTVATMSLVPCAVTWLCARARWRERVFVAAQSAAWMLFQVALMIDTRVWGLFRYHFNSAAWNLITTKGSEDSYRLGPKIWLVGCALGAAVFTCEWLAWKLLTSSKRRAQVRARLLRPALICASLVVLSVCVEKTIYARADLEQDRRIAAVSSVFPLYARVSVSALIPGPLLDLGARLPDVPVTCDDARFAYPDAPPRVAPSGPRPNILVLVVDSWRRDMLRADVTPELWRFAQGARRFDDHLSSGNGTRFGLFGLLYGLHGSYWWPALEARRGPLLLSALGALGYERGVFSSASMDYPEFRSTAWIDMLDAVHDDFGENRQCVRDEMAAQACLDAWRVRDRTRPFFSFVLLDGAHQRYDFPDDDAPFTPYAKDFDYLEMAGSRAPDLIERVRNRYMNALHHVDHVAALLLAELERSGELEHTLVIVTGDHGEEFAENGQWGHTGNFTAEQVAVPFLMRGPGVSAGVETRPTAHIDLPGTLLELLGARADERASWCLSENLLDPPATRNRVVAGWEELGVWTASGIFRIPRERSTGIGATVCDAGWRVLEDQRGAFAAQARGLERVVEECARFLALPSPPASSPSRR